MRDQFVGDIGDFAKYGLLRTLICDGSAARRLGVVWYANEDARDSSHGEGVSYLEDNASSYRACDHDLYDSLRSVVRSGRRRIFTVEESGLLGVDTPFWSELTPGRIPQRAGWLAGALKRVEGCDLVFLAVVRCAGGLAGMQNFDGARRLTNRLQWTLTRMGPMTTINTADDLIEVLKSDDKVRSAVRRELLTEELVALPERFDQMLETQTSILENIKGTRREQMALRNSTN